MSRVLDCEMPAGKSADEVKACLDNHGTAFVIGPDIIQQKLSPKGIRAYLWRQLNGKEVWEAEWSIRKHQVLVRAINNENVDADEAGKLWKLHEHPDAKTASVAHVFRVMVEWYRHVAEEHPELHTPAHALAELTRQRDAIEELVKAYAEMIA